MRQQSLVHIDVMVVAAFALAALRQVKQPSVRRAECRLNVCANFTISWISFRITVVNSVIVWVVETV